MTKAPFSRVTPATLAHAEILSALHEQIFGHEQDFWSAASFRELIAMPGAMALLAVKDKTGDDIPVGFALARFAADEGEIITIGVSPIEQRRGIARQLLQEIILFADEIPASLLLEVAEDNEAAKGFYRQAGFLQVGMRRNYYRRPSGQKIDANVMKRDPFSG